LSDLIDSIRSEKGLRRADVSVDAADVTERTADLAWAQGRP
jgi:hypothetical protein